MRERFTILRAFSSEKLNKSLNKWIEEKEYDDENFKVLSTSLQTWHWWLFPFICEYVMIVCYMYGEDIEEEAKIEFKERKETIQDKTYNQAIDELKERHTKIYMDAFYKCEKFIIEKKGTYEQAVSWIEDKKMKESVYKSLVLVEMITMIKLHKSYDVISDDIYKELVQYISSACDFSGLPLE